MITVYHQSLQCQWTSRYDATTQQSHQRRDLIGWRDAIWLAETIVKIWRQLINNFAWVDWQNENDLYDIWVAAVEGVGARTWTASFFRHNLWKSSRRIAGRHVYTLLGCIYSWRWQFYVSYLFYGRFYHHRIVDWDFSCRCIWAHDAVIFY